MTATQQCLAYFVFVSYAMCIERVPERERETRRESETSAVCLRGWQNTIEIVLFQISNSMKSYPSICHACTNKSRPVIGLC